MSGTNNLINELLEKTTKQQLLDDFYYTYSKKLELQERLKELEEKLESVLRVNNNLLEKINSLEEHKIEKSGNLIGVFDIDLQQFEIMFDFLPEIKYFDSEFQLIHDYYPTDEQKKKYKDLKHKLSKILVRNII